MSTNQISTKHLTPHSKTAIIAILHAAHVVSLVLTLLQIVQSLSSWCAQLCKQHCSKLQEGAGELGETTALDIGCGTGGCCFELALR